MEKSKMMLRYEQETGKQSAILKFITGGQALEQKSYPKLGPYDYNMEYIAWLEAKAEAYDRLTSKEGCEFCVNNSTKVLEHNGFKMTCYSTHYRYAELQIESPEHDSTGDFEINYCPMCGRELGMKNENGR